MVPNIMTPVLALIVWTFVIWFWLYATRLPAMRAARIDARKVKRKSDLDPLPVPVQQIADNYNHLHEQPTLFYALAIYCYTVGVADGLNVTLAWVYVGLRIAHSLIQCTSNYVPVRFLVFALASLVLMIIAARNVIALLVT
ncbi:MAPEG family protein [Povalibacter sp.]|uniref:MAPEG family protein n=1 Tax=Povalibacter sp. TaxID=1962978 RepID=UPI002F40F621